jgi:hypothetical protein
MNNNKENDSIIGRPVETGRPFQSTESGKESLVLELDNWQRDLDREIETTDRKSIARMNRIWREAQQIIVLALFLMGAVIIFMGMGFSVMTLLTEENDHQVELAKWILETELGALVAGLIGFTLVKSFEKM